MLVFVLHFGLFSKTIALMDKPGLDLDSALMELAKKS